MTFRDEVDAHRSTVFLNLDHFAETIDFVAGGATPSPSPAVSVNAVVSRQQALHPTFGERGKMTPERATIAIRSDADAGVVSVEVDRDTFEFDGKVWVVVTDHSSQMGMRTIDVERTTTRRVQRNGYEAQS